MKIADGVHVALHSNTKYKTNRIVFRMTASLNKQTIAKRALAFTNVGYSQPAPIQQCKLSKRD